MHWCMPGVYGCSFHQGFKFIIELSFLVLRLDYNFRYLSMLFAIKIVTSLFSISCYFTDFFILHFIKYNFENFFITKPTSYTFMINNLIVKGYTFKIDDLSFGDFSNNSW
jgi:hypothetical protein